MRGALGCLLLVACVEASVVQCPDGTTCPADSICGEAPTRCISGAQTSACEGKTEGDGCAVGGVMGSCTAGVCVLEYCGDGVKAAGEQCDGADLGGTDCLQEGFYATTTGVKCNANCTLNLAGCAETCGDDIKNGNELCDDADLGTATCITAGFYEPAGLKCSAFCTYNVEDCVGRCQDGIRNGAELCDSTPPAESCYQRGLDAGQLGCTTACGYDFAPCARFGFVVEPDAPEIACADLHASSATNAWAVGGITSFHYDGVAWTAIPTGSSKEASQVWVVSDTNAWLVVETGLLYQWNGTSWVQNATAPDEIRQVWAAPGGDLWAATGNSLHRWNGSTWSDVALPQGLVEVVALHGSDDNNVWAIEKTGLYGRWDGDEWIVGTITPFEVVTNDVHVFAVDDVWVVGTSTDGGLGNGAFFAHWDGLQWDVSARMGQGPDKLVASAPNDLWALGGITFHWDGTHWSEIPIDRACMSPLGYGDVLSISGGVVASFGGQTYSLLDLDPHTTAAPWRFTVLPTGEMFVSTISTGSVVQFDGHYWSLPKASSAMLRAFWAFAPDDVWAIGTSGKPTHWDGSDWTESTVANTSLMFAMYASGTNDLWAGGDNGRVLHYNGTWTTRNLPVSGSLDRVEFLSGTGPSDVWALTFSKDVYRWTGAWAQVPLPANFRADMLRVIGPNDVIAVDGTESVMQRWNGSTWTPTQLPTLYSFPHTIAAVAPDDIWMVGPTEMLHFNGAGWTPVRMPALTGGGTVHDAVVTPSRIHLLYSTGEIATLHRLRPWDCDVAETGSCNDLVDNDCDGGMDRFDADCP